jgi:hypothetical protein
MPSVDMPFIEARRASVRSKGAEAVMAGGMESIDEVLAADASRAFENLREKRWKA